MLWIESLNRQLFLAWTAGDLASPNAIAVATLVGETLIYVVPLALTFQWLWGTQKSRKMCIEAVLVTFLALGVNQLLIRVWPHPRPFMDGLGHQWLAHAPDPSFPSDHMTVLSSVGLTMLIAGFPLIGGLILIAAVLVAWARVYLGIHYPLDMVGGLVVSAMTLAIIHPLTQGLQEAVFVKLQKIYRYLFSRPIANGWFRL